ncbi:MAG: ankyrin repeat domain-containing protein [Gemmatimonadota bacterium]
MKWALILALLLSACDRRDEHSMTPLMYAAKRGDSAEITRLLRSGADIEARVKPHGGLKVMIAFISWMQQLPERDPGYSALMYAVRGGHLEAARILLDEGADPNVEANVMTALDLAMFSPRPLEMLRLLIARGASLTSSRGYQASPLAFAAEQGDPQAIRLLLTKGARIDAADRARITPLMAAARAGHSEAVKLLLQAGANPNLRDPNGWSAWRFASEKGHADIAQLLSGSDAAKEDVQNAALFAAITAEDPPAISAALAAGANPNGRAEDGRLAVEKAGGHRSEMAVLVLLDGGARLDSATAESVTYLAVVRGWERLFDRLVELGVKPSAELLTEAARMGQVNMVERLLARGADIHLFADQPLRTAALHGQLEVARLLLRKGARFDVEDRFGLTAFDEAAERGRADITQLFLEAGADPNRRRRGRPILSAAVQSGSPEVVRALLAAGADPAATDSTGQTALDYAKRRRYNERLIAALEGR